LWFHEVQVRVVLTLIGIGIAATSLSLALRLAHRALLAVVLAMNEKKIQKIPHPLHHHPLFPLSLDSPVVKFFFSYFIIVELLPYRHWRLHQSTSGGSESLDAQVAHWESSPTRVLRCSLGSKSRITRPRKTTTPKLNQQRK